MNFEPTKNGTVTILDESGKVVSDPAPGIFCFAKGTGWVISNIAPIRFKSVTAAPHGFIIRSVDGTKVGSGVFNAVDGEWSAGCDVTILPGQLLAELGL